MISRGILGNHRRILQDPLTVDDEIVSVIADVSITFHEQSGQVESLRRLQRRDDVIDGMSCVTANDSLDLVDGHLGEVDDLILGGCLDEAQQHGEVFHLQSAQVNELDDLLHQIEGLIHVDPQIIPEIEVGLKVIGARDEDAFVSAQGIIGGDNGNVLCFLKAVQERAQCRYAGSWHGLLHTKKDGLDDKVGCIVGKVKLHLRQAVHGKSRARSFGPHANECLGWIVLQQIGKLAAVV